ncbi:MAG: tRNA preQ1(34) S-adenosylmethionine ribosyltransferase-isomerase QueA [Firmicutes bacterium]|nr:tRNA preQ1(34) S-adenosylmethionine ribosyltransferase-isomerase QueA [Bacillota bacterium]
MNKSDFNYHLPKELIAQTPIEPRDHSRLLVYNRKTDKIEDRHFYDIVDYLNEGDALVINTTRVLPARIFGTRVSFVGISKEEQTARECAKSSEKTGAHVEFLLHKRITMDTWHILSKPAKRVKTGDVFTFSEKLKAEVLEELPDGERKVKFIYDGAFEAALSEVGQMPLPPYITKKLENKERYQTVYSNQEGSAAAPTAGLHFTPELMQKLRDKGVNFVEVLLHVGLGTFLPVKTDKVEDHKMHEEYFEITEDAVEKINKAKQNGKKVIALGTTSVRVLESVANNDGTLSAKNGFTGIYIYPPYKFKAVDALITNFHLPESTLIMLVSAFSTREKTLEIYNHAVKEKYRFFSFGDASLFL